MFYFNRLMIGINGIPLLFRILENVNTLMRLFPKKALQIDVIFFMEAKHIFAAV